MRFPNCPSLSSTPSLRVSNLITLVNTLGFILLILFISGVIEFPSLPFFSQSSTQPIKDNSKAFTDVVDAFKKWDSQVGCAKFKNEIGQRNGSIGSSTSLQDQFGGQLGCGVMKMKHVSVLVKEWTWIPDNLNNMYICQCGLSCLWTKSPVLADNPDAILFETTAPPPQQRSNGQSLRVYMNLDPERKRSGHEEVFISYHAKDDLQFTYARALLHDDPNYPSANKNNVPLVYWSSSQCTTQGNKVAHKLLSLLPHHSLGKCLNNVGGTNKALSLYPECVDDNALKPTKWWDHINCVISHYKFVLVIESTWRESYVTQNLFDALDSGAIPIYFGAPNVMDFVPPKSIVEGMKFKSMEELATYVKDIANDPIAYGEFHAWRRCGVLGNYVKARALSIETLPCRLCQAISIKGGRNAYI